MISEYPGLQTGMRWSGSYRFFIAHRPGFCVRLDISDWPVK